MQQKHTPVPIPMKLRWREFRIRFIPIIMFIIGLLVIWNLWGERVQSPDFIGRVMAPQTIITAPVDGLLTDVVVSDFSLVDQGGTIAVLRRAMPQELQARRARVQAEIDYIRASLYPIQTQQRSFVDYQGLRLDWMEKRMEQSALRADSVFIGNEFRRNERLFEAGFVEEQIYEDISARRAVNNTRLTETTLMMDDLQDRFNEIEDVLQFSTNTSAQTIDAAIRVQLAELEVLEQELGNVELRSPIHGVVQNLSKSLNSYVSRGDTLAVIEARAPEYIMGYLRQPFSVNPQIGMNVEIRSRKVDRKRYMAEITEMGAQIRAINPDMQRPGMSFESGLPIKIALSPEFGEAFYPGELVDLILQPTR